MTLRATPAVGFAPTRVVLTAELKGGANDYEEFYCAAVEWAWGDDTKSESKSDCDPYQPGKSDFAGKFEVQAYQLQKVALEFDLKKSVVFRGETVVGDLVARYQYGAPAANRPVAVRLPEGNARGNERYPRRDEQRDSRRDGQRARRDEPHARREETANARPFVHHEDESRRTRAEESKRARVEESKGARVEEDGAHTGEFVAPVLRERPFVLVRPPCRGLRGDALQEVRGFSVFVCRVESWHSRPRQAKYRDARGNQGDEPASMIEVGHPSC